MKTKIQKFIGSGLNRMGKKQIILSGFLAMAGVANAQWTNACPTILTGCDAGIGTTSAPADKLHIVSTAQTPADGGGALIEHTTGWASILRLKTSTTSLVTSNYGLYASGTSNGIGSGGHFAIFDYKAGVHRFMIQGGTGNIGIGSFGSQTAFGPSGPTEQLHTTGGVRFAGLPAGNGSEGYVRIDMNTGKLYKTNNGGGILNACVTQNFIPKVAQSGSGNLTCSQIFDNGVGVGIGSIGPFGYTTWSGGLTGNNVPPTSGNYLLDVNGSTRALAYYATSDIRFKKDINPIKDAIDIIRQLEGKTYYWKIEEFKDKTFSGSRQYGFIAQELEKVIPEVVATDANGYKSVNYDMVIPILVQAIKEQQKTIDNLQSRITNTEIKISTANSINQINSDNNGLSLEQNIPNPFSHETVINYSLPQQIKNASLIVYDLSGKQLISFPLDLNGKSISINSDKLAAGIYIYSVMADGKIMDSKRMVVSDKQ